MQYLFSLLSICFVFGAYGQTPIMIEDFNSGIPSATWTIIDSDGLTPDSSVMYLTSAWNTFETSTDTCAASTSFYSPVGQSMDYLITPQITIATYTKVTWKAKSFDASYPDGYAVLISTTDNQASSFTDTLLTIDSEGSFWNERSIHLDLEGYANQDIFIAFYHNTNDGYILQIDDFGVYGSDNASLNETEELNISIYPNPATEFIQIQNTDENFNVRILSIDGKEILQSSDSNIDVSSLEQGTYILIYESTAGVSTQQFIKL